MTIRSLLQTTRLALGMIAAIATTTAFAFTFSDGASMQCVAAGRRVPEIEVPADAQAQFTGRTVTSESGYRILWNPARLNALPPVMRDFLFFHECAHAQLGTLEELAANCAGLKAMREAGRAGLAVEAKIAAFYGPTNPYWVQTLKCADGASAPTR